MFFILKLYQLLLRKVVVGIFVHEEMQMFPQASIFFKSAFKVSLGHDLRSYVSKPVKDSPVRADHRLLQF